MPGPNVGPSVHLCQALPVSEAWLGRELLREGTRPGPSPIPPRAQVTLYPPHSWRLSLQFSHPIGPAQEKGTKSPGLYPTP